MRSHRFDGYFYTKVRCHILFINQNKLNIYFCIVHFSSQVWMKPVWPSCFFLCVCFVLHFKLRVFFSSSFKQHAFWPVLLKWVRIVYIENLLQRISKKKNVNKINDDDVIVGAVVMCSITHFIADPSLKLEHTYHLSVFF